MIIPLRAKSYYSFGYGSASPEALVQRAAALGYSALALTDIESLAGQLTFTISAARTASGRSAVSSCGRASIAGRRACAPGGLCCLPGTAPAIGAFVLSLAAGGAVPARPPGSASP